MFGIRSLEDDGAFEMLHMFFGKPDRQIPFSLTKTPLEVGFVRDRFIFQLQSRRQHITRLS